MVFTSMKKRFSDRWPILIAPLFFDLADWIVTYMKQPPPGARTAENLTEGNPIARIAMLSGMGAEVAFHLAWTLVIVVPILLLPRFCAYCWSLGWTFGHASAVLTWLIYGYALGYWTNYWYCPLVAVMVAFTSRRFFSAAK
jgi:hypothetical protein